MDATTKLVCPVEGERLPAYSHPGDAGADLRADNAGVVPARGQTLVSTGIRLALPDGCVGLVWPRSGLAVNRSIDCGAGVIDSGYRGEIRVLLFNHSDADFEYEAGDRIAQLLVVKFESLLFRQVDSLDATGRGEGGFGSTDG
ncbi:MAG: dUTP diphosphatase [Candidatus Nitrohelix vancouverensis]|uniref:dUTP diphosphatase n=1 Tax=Candidatus Nitrohelix vancouverensis TaxID=2705534 RepID=A0A7T0G389_9BACT|nr:MAG: dUTP diphosphatase [Candidatus Nitrohelix vancouverensis]